MISTILQELWSTISCGIPSEFAGFELNTSRRIKQYRRIVPILKTILYFVTVKFRRYKLRVKGYHGPSKRNWDTIIMAIDLQAFQSTFDTNYPNMLHFLLLKFFWAFCNVIDREASFSFCIIDYWFSKRFMIMKSSKRSKAMWSSALRIHTLVINTYTQRWLIKQKVTSGAFKHVLASRILISFMQISAWHTKVTSATSWNQWFTI